jgi:hypothetical protein
MIFLITISGVLPLMALGLIPAAAAVVRLEIAVIILPVHVKKMLGHYLLEHTA